MRDAMMSRLADLRFEPTEKRIRVMVGDDVLADTTRALLVWEPRRIVPSYAVPLEELRGELSSEPETTLDAERFLHPGIPFAVHSTPGGSFTVHAGGEDRTAAAFAPADEDLAGYVVLDFRAFRWLEEDDPLVSHPRDPYHRIDIRPSSRHVRVEFNGELLAESRRPSLLFETHLPTRFYLPADDIVGPLQPSEKRTFCAYKGQASYWSHADLPNLAWTYRQPLPDAVQIAGMVAFYDDLVDVTVDGVLRERPSTPFAKSLIEEANLEDASVERARVGEAS
jgi:uncharacterized protein (DUF427 family)